MTLDATFERLRADDETAWIPYVTAGYPSLDATLDSLRVMAANGADIIEVGVPFGDPVADGPTIQAASQVALDAGITLRAIVDALKLEDFGVPLVLMSYLNPLLAYGRDALLDDLVAARVSGLIVPDLPAEEAGEWRDAARARGIHLVLLVAPTSPPERIRRIAESATGFLYYVSVTGTTGARDELPADLFDALATIRGITDMPVAVGFGISRREHVRGLRGKAEGAVVGSRIVEAIRRGEDLAGLIRDLKQATRSESHVDRDAV
jgi:tryptophan synthase alpha chain